MEQKFYETIFYHPLFWIFSVSSVAGLILYLLYRCIKSKRKRGNNFSTSTTSIWDNILSNGDNFQSQATLIPPKLNQKERSQDRNDRSRIINEDVMDV